ncbi:hypothetical protein JHW43_001334 [Diplocarpon mali]|nr:hypothetical protein JHW43_001334 [Diplocarpon mali]
MHIHRDNIKHLLHRFKTWVRGFGTLSRVQDSVPLPPILIFVTTEITTVYEAAPLDAYNDIPGRDPNLGRLIFNLHFAFPGGERSAYRSTISRMLQGEVTADPGRDAFI